MCLRHFLQNFQGSLPSIVDLTYLNTTGQGPVLIYEGLLYYTCATFTEHYVAGDGNCRAILGRLFCCDHVASSLGAQESPASIHGGSACLRFLCVPSQAVPPLRSPLRHCGAPVASQFSVDLVWMKSHNFFSVCK